MTQPRLPHRQVNFFAQRQIANRRANESAAQLRRIAETEPRAVLGVVAYWLGPEFSEGANRVHA
jgi:hypothetical protein